MVFTQTKARKEHREENALGKTVARAPNTWTRQSADKRSLYLARSCGGNYYYYSIGFSFILDYLIVRHCGRLEKNRCYPKCYIYVENYNEKLKIWWETKSGYACDDVVYRWQWVVARCGRHVRREHHVIEVIHLLRAVPIYMQQQRSGGGQNGALEIFRPRPRVLGITCTRTNTIYNKSIAIGFERPFAPQIT